MIEPKEIVQFPWTKETGTMYSRLSIESTLTSLGKLFAIAVAVAIMSATTTGPTHDHAALIYAWLGVGLISAALIASIPIIHIMAPKLEQPVLGVMALLDISVLVAVIALTGGIEGPFWVLVLVNTAGAAVISESRKTATLSSCLYVAALVGATALAHTLTKANSGPLVLVGLCTPLVALLGSSVSESLEAQRVASATERDRLKSTVDELSAALAQAAQGDLSVHVEADADAQS
ncbi:MAG TPA: hypothetical protein VMH41_03935, partial [Mycobacteriales bacterium]|nr:hypothetical protein [Mycobacteriales bacterium]